MWTGDLAPARVLIRIQGLHSEPYSRYRAAYMRDHPPTISNDAPSWLGWTQEAGMLAALTNVQLMKGSRKKLPQSALVKTPADQKAKPKVFSSIADFAANFTRR